jgi:hypothetical protein
VKVGEGSGVGEYAATVWVIMTEAICTDMVPITSTVGVAGACGEQAVNRTKLKIVKDKKRHFISLTSLGVGKTSHSVYCVKYIKQLLLPFWRCFPMYNVSMLKVFYRAHAVQRMFERDISAEKIRRALEVEDVIEDYSSEMPEPSRLLMGFKGRHPFHVVTSENPGAGEVTVVTVYLPDADKWKKDFRSRK